MPITPFHFGPGLFFKSIFTRWFSFRVFVWANILIDFEPLYFILKGQLPYHRFFHTYLGAFIIAIICIITARPLCYVVTSAWSNIFKNTMISNERISKSAIIISAFIGTYSHILLDSIMHGDMVPLYPLSNSNSLLNILTFNELHLLCVLFCIAGVIILLFRKMVFRLLKSKEGRYQNANTDNEL